MTLKRALVLIAALSIGCFIAAARADAAVFESDRQTEAEALYDLPYLTTAPRRARASCSGDVCSVRWHTRQLDQSPTFRGLDRLRRPRRYTIACRATLTYSRDGQMILYALTAPACTGTAASATRHLH